MSLASTLRLWISAPKLNSTKRARRRQSRRNLARRNFLLERSLGYGYDYTNAFVTKLNAAGSALVYSTYLGGTGHHNDSGNGIAIDAAYVTGSTQSTNFPTANALQAAFGGGQDAFVAKFSAAGSSLVYSTYLGGSGGRVGPRYGAGITPTR